MRVLASVIGQSNEMGSGDIPDRNWTGFGNPFYSINRGWWVKLSENLGRSGIFLDLNNTAIGSTSLANYWVGILRNWTSGTPIQYGTYISASNNIYKCVSASSFVSNSTIIPSGSNDIITSDNISWRFISSANSYDNIGTVYDKNDQRFDPNNILTTIKNYFDSKSFGYDEKWLFISIGQTDKTMSTTKEQYKQSIINAVEYLKDSVDKIFIGFTCYGATADLDNYFIDNLIPGYEESLEYFSGDAKIKRGVNLRYELGILPVSPILNSPGLKSDQLHMNDYALDLAANVWYLNIKNNI